MKKYTKPPTFVTEFPDQLDRRCAGDEICSNTGKVAYLHDLYRSALSFEAFGKSEEIIKLSSRRPDIGALILEPGSLDGQESVLKQVVSILKNKMNEGLVPGKSPHQALAESTGMPESQLNYPLAQIEEVLANKKIQIFDVLQQATYSYPNFRNAKLHGNELREVMLKASGIGSVVAKVLQQSEVGKADNKDGAPDEQKSASETPGDVEELVRQTGLSTEQIEEVLAEEAGATRIKVSKYYASKALSAVAGHVFAASFINNGGSVALKLAIDEMGRRVISGAKADTFERIHKFLHLRHALGLSFSETDLLLISILRAEGQIKNFTISENTLRAIGVFRYLYGSFGVSVEQFSALVHQVTPYTMGTHKAFLDRVLNVNETDETPLVLDDREFDLSMDACGTPNSIIRKLSYALGVSEEVVQLHLVRITKVLGLTKPTLSLRVLSALYRLIKFPQLLRLSYAEGSAMLAVLDIGNPGVLDILAGEPKITDELDILDVLVGLVNLRHWMTRNNLSAPAVLKLLCGVPGSQGVQLDAQASFGMTSHLRQVLLAMGPRLREVPFNIAGLTEKLSVKCGWPGTVSVLLEDFVDKQGWVTSGLASRPKDLKENILPRVGGNHDVADMIVSEIMNSLVAQEDLVKAAVSSALSNEVLPEHVLALLQWAKESLATVLSDMKAAVDSEVAYAEGGDIKRGISVALWCKLACHARAVRMTDLSPQGLEALTRHSEWFSSEGVDYYEHKVSLDTLCVLTCYRAWIDQCKANGLEESDAIDYLHSHPVNEMSRGLELAMERLAVQLGWEQEEIFYAFPQLAVEKSLSLDPPPGGTLAAFLESLSVREQRYFYACAQAGLVLGLVRVLDEEAAQGTDSAGSMSVSICQKLKAYIKSNKGGLKIPPTDAVVLERFRPYYSSLGIVSGAPEYKRTVKPVFNDFLTTLTTGELRRYSEPGYGFRQLMRDYHRLSDDFGYVGARNLIVRKFNKFIKDNPGPLRVTAEQKDIGYEPERWAGYRLEPGRANDVFSNKLEFEVYAPRVADSSEKIPLVPEKIDDIAYIMRVQALALKTGLHSRWLRETSQVKMDATFNQWAALSDAWLATCPEPVREKIQATLDQRERTALASYLKGWVTEDVNGVKRSVIALEDLSEFFLIDIGVGPSVGANKCSLAIQCLQFYLHRVYMRVEPGYQDVDFGPGGVEHWRKVLSQYETWRAYKMESNHPENLISYTRLPGKSKAYQELEIDLNKGRLDTELLHSAVSTYLHKFERVCNLQVVSGYLEGASPRNGRYHFIGKTNTSPAEYYWRTLSVSQDVEVDDFHSALDWSEWEKINVPISGQIVQVKDKVQNSEDLVQLLDVVRPVVISGRKYVFWVERGTIEGDGYSTTLQQTKLRKSVNVKYVYQQSDGFWSPANEVLCLDGKKNGQAAVPVTGVDSSKVDNPYLKQDGFSPELIVFVNEEGERHTDPWLMVMMYDTAAISSKGHKFEEMVLDCDYYMEARDLLLLDSQPVKSEMSLVSELYKYHAAHRNIQFSYMGETSDLVVKDVSKSTKIVGMQDRLDIVQDFDDGRMINVYGSVVWDGSPPGFIVLTVELIGQGYRTKVTQPALYEKGPVVEIKVRELLADASWCAVVMSFEIGQTKYRWERKCQLKYAKKGEAWGVSIGRNVGQAQYLEVKARSGVGSDLVRLNTLFGKQLVARSSEGVKKVLSWSTQSLSEPALLSTEQPQIVDFKGANGLYFYELFLHLPLMVAVRLSEQGQHDEAQSWFNAHLFDPYRLEELADGTAPVWGARPLAEEGYTSYQQYAARPGTALKQADIYRRAIFLEFLENWQRQGDHAYRRLTVSGLSQAWMCYQDALKLIGPFPGLKMASPWNTVSLGDLKRTVFRHPVNERIVRLRSRLESRIYNLRNGLALDGKRIPSADIDVQDNVSLSAFGGGKSLVDQNYNGEGGTIPAYRFRHLLPATRAAVQQLLDLGRHYMKLMEDQFNTGFSVQLKAQEMKIAEFVIRAQQEQLEAARARRAALVISRDAAVFRKEHYAGLLEEGRSALEEAASATISSSALMKYAAIPTEIVAGGIDGLVPTILGMAVGGTKPSELTRMTAKAMDMGSTALKFISEQLLVESGYERRATEWRFAQGESEWDIKVLEQQLVEADIDVKAATTALEQVKQDAVNLQAAYTSMTTGFTIIPTYDWLVARQELLYGAAYDAVFSQCMSLQAAWRFELGDYKTQSFIKPSAWNDSFKGMLAGESLMVDLQAMENDYLMNNERRLTIKKTFSLYDSLESYCGEVVEQSLNQDNVAGAKREAEFKKRFLTLREAGWVKNLNLLRKGLFRFGTPQRFFDDNFPGHYKRQIKHVSFSLLTKTPSPFEISAVVTQTHSQILTEPDAVGAEFIRSMNIHEAPKNVPPSTVKLDLRSGQKVTLTSTLAEDGLGYGPGLWVYELMMHDGRYLPFEGTGACSAWRLEIPHVKFAEWLAGGGDNSVYEKANLKDLQIHMVYTALDGGASFGEKIRGLQSKHRVDEKKLSYDQSAPE